MKRSFLLRAMLVRVAMFLILTSSAIVLGQTGSVFQPPKLKGIINFPDRKCALLELSKASYLGQNLILSEGQREGPIEVLQINPGGVNVIKGADRAETTYRRAYCKSSRY